MSQAEFTLFVAGDTPRSRQAIQNLRRLGEEHLGGAYRLMVIDVIVDPATAETSRILATPTLVKERPLPLRRVTGDLSDSAKLLRALALPHDANNDQATS